MQNFFHADTSKARTVCEKASVAVGAVLALPALLSLMSLIIQTRMWRTEGFLAAGLAVPAICVAVWLAFTFLLFFICETRSRRIKRCTYFEIQKSAAMPKLLERAGNFEKGSITGIYAVLVEGDDTNEPISDTVRGIIDGHIVLSRKIAAQNHYPAIDILPSISRLMSAIADPEHNKAAGKLRNLLALYNNNADLISIGAYKKGTNPALDEAIKKIDKINDFLMQGMYESFSMEDTIKLLKAAVS